VGLSICGLVDIIGFLSDKLTDLTATPPECKESEWSQLLTLLPVGLSICGLVDIISFLTGKLTALYNLLVSIVDYLNPMSESFILKIAFIPEQGCFQGENPRTYFYCYS
jgi:hypothetical protein